jgi:hypothetical protein
VLLSRYEFDTHGLSPQSNGAAAIEVPPQRHWSKTAARLADNLVPHRGRDKMVPLSAAHVQGSCEALLGSWLEVPKALKSGRASLQYSYFVDPISR